MENLTSAEQSWVARMVEQASKGTTEQRTRFAVECETRATNIEQARKGGHNLPGPKIEGGNAGPEALREAGRHIRSI